MAVDVKLMYDKNINLQKNYNLNKRKIMVSQTEKAC